MKYKLIQEENVENLGNVGYVEAPFDEALQLLQENEYQAPISGRDLAFARIKKGVDSSLSQYGSYIREGMLREPKEPQRVLFLSISSIIEDAKKATQAHRAGSEYIPSDKIVEEYRNQAEEDMKKDPQDRRVFIAPKAESYTISTKSLDEDELALWLFKDQVKKYKELLQENNIEEMPVWLPGADYIKSQDKPFERQLWLHHLGDGSELSGYYGGFYCDFRLRGVSRGAVTAEGGSQKISESYTLKDITEALETLKLEGLEQLILDQLKQKD